MTRDTTVYGHKQLSKTYIWLIFRHEWAQLEISQRVSDQREAGKSGEPEETERQALPGRLGW